MKTKRIIKPKYKLSGVQVFTFSFPEGEAIPPSGLLSVTSLLFTQYKKTWLVRKHLRMLVEYVLVT